MCAKTGQMWRNSLAKQCRTLNLIKIVKRLEGRSDLPLLDIDLADMKGAFHQPYGD